MLYHVHVAERLAQFHMFSARSRPSSAESMNTERYGTLPGSSEAQRQMANEAVDPRNHGSH